MRGALNSLVLSIVFITQSAAILHLAARPWNVENDGSFFHGYTAQTKRFRLTLSCSAVEFARARDSCRHR